MSALTSAMEYCAQPVPMRPKDAPPGRAPPAQSAIKIDITVAVRAVEAQEHQGDPQG